LLVHFAPATGLHGLLMRLCRLCRWKLVLALCCSLLLALTSIPILISAQTVLLGPGTQQSPDIEARAYVLYDAQSGTFLLGENQDEPLPPASITKVMTALLALENLAMTDMLTISKEMFASIPNDYARLGLVEGENITVEEALYASLLISANDAAMALAITMGGSVAGFADLMNKRATELGCRQTHFTNPYGLAEADHLTSARDMALITAEALKHPSFCAITKTKNHILPPTNMFESIRGLPNGNRFVSTSEFAYASYLGGKTGYTKLSGHTIVAGAGQDQRTLVAVILGAPNARDRYGEVIRLFDYGFSAYTTEPIDPADYVSIKDQTVAHVRAELARQDRLMEITAVELELFAAITYPNALDDKQPGVDLDQVIVQEHATGYVRRYPLYTQVSEANRYQTGWLVLTVQALQPSASITTGTPDTDSTSTPDTEPDLPADTAGPSIWRWLLIVLLTAVVILGLLLLFAMVQRDLNKRRRKRSPPR